MSYRVNFQKVPGWAEKCFTENNQQTPLNVIFTWAPIIVGINEITETNAAEFWDRLNLYQTQIGGIAMNSEGQQLFANELDVESMIGLHTNASLLTRARFNRKIKNLLKEMKAAEAEKESEDA